MRHHLYRQGQDRARKVKLQSHSYIRCAYVHVQTKKTWFLFDKHHSSLLSNDHDTFCLKQPPEMVSSCEGSGSFGKSMGPTRLPGRFRAAEKGFHLSASPFFLILNTARLGTLPGFGDMPLPYADQLPYVLFMRHHQALSGHL